jgi:hypothetical protein
MNANMTTPAECDQMRHRIHSRFAVMADELVPIYLAAYPAPETITPQNVIEQAVKVFAGMSLSAFTTGAQPAAESFGAATAEKRLLQHFVQDNPVCVQSDRKPV